MQEQNTIESDLVPLEKELRSALDLIEERDLTISKLNTDAIDTANVIAELDDKLEERDREIESLKAKIKSFDLAEWEASKGGFDETLHRNFLQKIWEQEQEIKQLNEGYEILVAASNELDRKSKLEIAERDRTIELLKIQIENLLGDRNERDLKIADLNRLLSLQCEETYDLVMLKQSLEVDLVGRDREIKELQNAIDVYQTNIQDHKKGIQELEITLKNHREQFDNLKAHFEVTLKAIAMNLNALKGVRKPDETKDVDGVMVTFRNYDDSLTHHHKTIIIENVQMAIAEETKKLKGANLKDFSFDDIPF